MPELTLPGGATAPHELGGEKHIADTLANLQTKVSNAVLAASAAALTSGRLPYVTAGGLLKDSASLTFNEGTNVVSTGGLNLSSLTASKFVATDGSKNLVSRDIDSTDVAYTRLTATTQTVTVGTLSSGTVSDTQVWQDGNVVNISEVTGTPGFDVRYTIPNVADFTHVIASFEYQGSSAHDCELQIYDQNAAAWRSLHSELGTMIGYCTHSIILPDDTSDYIDGSGNVLVRLYHPGSGNPAHDLYIDYVAIVGKSI